MRPTYETTMDRQNEINFAKKLERRGYVMHQCKKYYDCDFYAEKGDYKALIEYRNRKVKRGAYPTIILSAAKFASLRNAAKELGIRFLFFIEYVDSLCAIDLTEYTGFHVEIGGSTRRNDPQDIEPCVHIPIGHLTTLEQGV